MIVVWHKVRSFFGGYEDEKEELENPIITYFTTVCRCGCAARKNEMGAAAVGADPQKVRIRTDRVT